MAPTGKRTGESTRSAAPALPSSAGYLDGQLLIAMPTLRDPNFARGVTFLCQHGEDGAMGLMINRLSEYRLGDVLAQMNMSSELPDVIDAPVLIGGPMQPERGFVLHSPQGEWESSFRISDRLSVTTSRDILVAMAAGEGPRHAIVTLGYSGWSPGQLEDEMKREAWLTHPATLDLVFDSAPEKLWKAILRQKGLKYRLLADAPEDVSLN